MAKKGKTYTLKQPRRQTLSRLLSYFKPVRGRLIFVIIIVALSAILLVAAPVVLGDILDKVMEADLALNPYLSLDANGLIVIDWQPIITSFSLMIAFYVLNALVMWLADWIVIRVSTEYSYNLRQEIKLKLDRVPLSYYDQTPYGDILSRGTNDVQSISDSISTIVIHSIKGIGMALASVVAMFVVSWQLALIAISVVPVALIVTLPITLISQRQFVKFRANLGEVEAHAEENISGYTVVKLFNQEENVKNQFALQNEELQRSEYKAQFFGSVIYPLMRSINNLGFIAVAVGGALIDGGGINLIVPFLMLLQMFTRPLTDLGNIVSTINLTIASAERIFFLLDEEEMVEEGPDAITDLSNIEGRVTFENVAFSYEEDQSLITNMNLEVNPGDSIAIVGPTGAGKTTLVNLIMRFYEIDEGSIKLDGVDIRNYSRGALRRSIGMVLQDTWLFHGSINNNIKYGRNGASDEDVVEAAIAAHADHFIQTLPGGYEFVLNEDGTNISQGQRQLLTIARAMISEPKILILDEATSNVDTRTEILVQDAMNRLMKGRTSFIIAHRLSTIKNAKTIMVMRDGDIIEVGNHQQLIEADGFYADMYNAQFLGIDEDEELVD
ncbi:MAG: ABC transporter ATP-binding protein [Erysipelotrichaceae bacterium]|nr:ABC transporter ATP-binding protein [Erysipelotrichaceae bacterium]